MLKLLSVTALASALALSTAELAPVSAGGHGMHMGGGGHYHFSHAGHFNHVHPHHIAHIQHLGQHHHHHFHWRHGSYWAVGVPVAVGVAGVATYAASGPAPVCTCLTKDYLDDGSVRFTDTCTREYAVAMPPEQAPVK